MNRQGTFLVVGFLGPLTDLALAATYTWNAAMDYFAQAINRLCSRFVEITYSHWLGAVCTGVFP